MTANQQYRQYKKEGGQLSFREWIDREKKKEFLHLDGQGAVPVNKPLNDSIQQVLYNIHKSNGYQDSLTNEYILGIHKTVWIGLGVVVVVGGGLLIYKNISKK